MPQLIEAGIPAAPDMDAVAQRYRAFEHALQSGSPATWLPTFREWDVLRRELATWASLTNLRFTQDTRDEAARKGAVEDASPQGDNEQRSSLTGQLGHRDQEELLKDNDTDFPEPDAQAEHTGE